MGNAGKQLNGEHLDGNHLNDRGLNGPNSTRTSARVIARAGVSWNERTTTLGPVLGDRGVTELYLHALEAAESEYPWLTEVREQALTSHPFAPLLARLSLCTPGTAAAVQACLLEQFDRQLAELVGDSLAQRLLATVRASADGANTLPAPRPDEIGEQLTLTALRAGAEARLARCERDLALRAGAHDDLTGVANRTRMLDRLKSAIALAKRTDTPTAVLFIDLDHFKRINDDMGHRVGDDMLRAVASRLQDAVRQTDTVCRFGGDEFVVILTPMERRSEAKPAAERILKAIAEVHGTDPARTALSASVGISLYPENGTDPDALINHADQSMYRYKRARLDPSPDLNAAAKPCRGQPDSARPARNNVALIYGMLAGPTWGE